MLIVCPTCATSYDVDAASLRPNGRQVRCVRCRAVWRAELSHADKLIAAAEALAPVRRAVEAMSEATTAEATMAEAATATESLNPPPLIEEQAAAAPALGTPEEPPPAAPADEPLAAAMPESVTPDAAADQVVAVDSPSIAPVDLDADRPMLDAAATHDAVPAEEPSEDIESVAARRFRAGAKRQRRGWPLSRLQSAILALVIIDGIIFGWRSDFVRALPQTASFYAAIGMPVNLRGVTFDGLTTNTEQHEGVPILVVEGNIINKAGRMIVVPRLRFAVRNAAREEIYSWTAVPPRAALPPGEAVSFRTRLASPPPDAHDVVVRFVNRFDVLSGSR